MEGTITIPQQIIDSYQELEEAVSVKIKRGSSIVEVEILIDGKLKIVRPDLSTIWSGLTTEQKTIIKTFLKAAGVEAINKWHTDEGDGATVSDTDFTDFDLQQT
jgi:hypothetical protein